MRRKSGVLGDSLGPSAILESLHDDAAHRSAALIGAAQLRLGLPSLGPLPMRIDRKRGPATKDDHAISAFRGALAGQFAIAELAARGVIIPARSDDVSRGSEVPERAYFKLENPSGTSNTEPIETGAPDIAFAYKMASWPGLDEPWYLDPDLLAEPELAGIV